ncbi:MAG: hypothetical protein F6K56_43645 [Moorea sp. SIO3G5]|nr:hypothetical protein [Moorena sp. SIO3G5]
MPTPPNGSDTRQALLTIRDAPPHRNNTKIRFFRSLIADKPAFKAVGHATRTALFISTYIIAIPYIPCAKFIPHLCAA